MKAKSILLPMVLGVSMLSAAVPQSILFQGTMSQAGVSASGSLPMTIKLCTNVDATVTTGCTTVLSQSVAFNKGYYAVNLPGDGFALPTFDKQYYVDITLDSKPTGVRIPLTSTPYALRSDIADSAGHAATAVTASNATKAVLADSATGALRSTTSLTSSKAALADSATGALRSAKSAVADSAGKAGFAVKMTGISVDADTVKFTKNILKFAPSYAGLLETGWTSGANWKYATMNLDPVTPSILLSVSGGGANSGNGAGLIIAMDSITTSAPIRSTAGFNTDGNVVATSVTASSSVVANSANITGSLIVGGIISGTGQIATPILKVRSSTEGTCDASTLGQIIMVSLPGGYQLEMCTRINNVYAWKAFAFQ